MPYAHSTVTDVCNSINYTQLRLLSLVSLAYTAVSTDQNSCPVGLTYYTQTLHAFAALALSVEDALLSTFPHLVFLSLKWADEHSDTSMATQMHSMVALSTQIMLKDCL